MQISKLFPAVCAVAFFAGSITVQADDTPAQAAARSALMGQMSAPEAQPAQPAQPAPPPIVVTPSGAAMVQPSQPTNKVVVSRPAVHAQPAVPAAQMNPVPDSGAAQTTPALSDAEAQTRARAALEQKMANMNQQDWATPAIAPAASPAPPAISPEMMSPPDRDNANFSGKELGLKPIEAPPLPISASKEAQLQALLERYKADQITPGEYQTERAKILAEP